MSYTPQTELRMKYKRREGNPATPLRAANLVLPGLSLRTVQGQRYKAVVEDLVAEFGSAEMTRLRELAALRIALEQTQSEVVGGNAAVRQDMVRISNLVTRKENELRRRMAAAAQVKDTRPLHERIMGVGRLAKPAGSGAAATRIERMGASRREAGNAVHSDEQDEDG